MVVLGMIELSTPVAEATIRSLKVGDQVSINGTLFTGRDAVHKYLHQGGLATQPIANRRYGRLKID